MHKKSLAEAIFLFNRIETLLRKRGGTGESFSDLVKSFNAYLDREEEIKASKRHADGMGYKFYYDRDEGAYNIKEKYLKEHGIFEELSVYQSCREQYSDYIAYKRGLIGGFYNNLRSIAFERNNLLHQDNYTIKNFPRFKKACYQVIDFLEKGKQPRFGIINLHRNDSLRNRLTTFAWDSPSFWLRILLTVPIVYGLFRYFNLCLDCLETARYLWIGGVSLFFYSLIFLLWDILKFAFRSEENMQAVVFGIGIVFVGSIFFAHSCSGGKEHTASSSLSDAEGACSYYLVDANRLNVRAGASSSARRVERLSRNTKVCVTQIKGMWAYVPGKGWVHKRYLIPFRHGNAESLPATTREPKIQKSVSSKEPKHSHKNVSVKKRPVRKHKPVVVWHCTARSKRASGWVEKIGLEVAKKGALHQCEIRRQTEVPCRITDCYEM